LPGGEKAIKEPRRVAIGVLHELFGDDAFEMEELAPVCAFTSAEGRVLRSMLNSNVNAPITSSAGRLFDAVASIIGLRQRVRFEGQAAMELEFALDGVMTDEAYGLGISSCRFERNKFVRDSQSAIIIDWEPAIREILDDVSARVPLGLISAKFHNALVEAIIAIALRIGEERVVLTGGCFQNRYLTERTVKRLEREGFRAYWHQRVPPNDGGIALGQVAAAMRSIAASANRPTHV
jgi:hydrogenase maturation protein HypF